MDHSYVFIILKINERLRILSYRWKITKTFDIFLYCINFIITKIRGLKYLS